MQYSIVCVPFFVLALALPAMAETHSLGGQTPYRTQAKSSSAKLSEMVSACLSGRPPLIRSAQNFGPALPQFPSLVGQPSAGSHSDGSVGGTKPKTSPKPKPKVEILPPPEDKKEAACQIACTMEYAPVTCDVQYWVDDMGYNEKISAGNECVVRLKACQRHDDFVREFETVKCTPKYVSEGIPKDLFVEDTVFGDKWDKPQFHIQLLRQDGGMTAIGDLVEVDGKLLLNGGYELYELDTSDLSAAQVSSLKTKKDLTGGESLAIRGKMSYIEDARLKEIGGRKHYSKDKHKFARSDRYKLKISSFDVVVE